MNNRCCCATESCRMDKLSSVYVAVQTPLASMWLAAGKAGRGHVLCGANAFG